MNDDEKIRELMERMSQDAQTVVKALTEPILTEMKRTSGSAVATALIRILAGLLMNDPRGDQAVGTALAVGLVEEMKFARKHLESINMADSLVSNGDARRRERNERPKRRMP